MRVIRVTADLTVPDLDAAKVFYTDFLGLDAQDMGLDWVTRVVVPSSDEHIQLLSQDATGPENPLLSVKVDDVDEAYAAAQRLGYEIVHPLTTEPMGHPPILRKGTGCGRTQHCSAPGAKRVTPVAVRAWHHCRSQITITPRRCRKPNLKRHANTERPRRGQTVVPVSGKTGLVIVPDEEG